MTLRKVAKELEKENQRNLNWVPIWPASVVIKVRVNSLFEFTFKIGSILTNELLRVAKISVRYDDPEKPEEKM